MLGWQNGEIVYFPCSIPGHNIKNYVGSDVISAPSFFLLRKTILSLSKIRSSEFKAYVDTDL